MIHHLCQHCVHASNFFVYLYRRYSFSFSSKVMEGELTHSPSIPDVMQNASQISLVILSFDLNSTSVSLNAGAHLTARALLQSKQCNERLPEMVFCPHSARCSLSRSLFIPVKTATVLTALPLFKIKSGSGCF